MSFSFLNRNQHIEKMKNNEFDLVIIGGGITGAGVARDAASRGMKVALLEANDFAFGASSRSTKLIHGGIRYLENLEFHLVFEALSERKLLFEIAPHLVHPLRFMLPLYNEDRVGMFKMGLGMWLYDALSLFEAPQLHERLNKFETAARAPFLRNQGLKGSFIYSDAYMDDDRLVLETLRSAHNLGAVAANFVNVKKARFENNKVESLECEDLVSKQNFSVKGKHFISTVGPWTDIFGIHIFQSWKKILRPSKGIHITLEKNRLPLSEAIVMAAGRDEKRIIFGIPRHEMIIMGTTDTDYEGDPAEVRSEATDVNYVLEVVEKYFPGAKITKNDIIGSYAGVRPLVDDGAATESKTSREHLILNDPRNVTFVAGGKYTTYRLMAEQTVNSVLKKYFSIEDQVRFFRSNTKVCLNSKATIEKLENARRDVDYIVENSKFSKLEASFLIDRHAEEAFDILNKYYSSEISSIWDLEAEFAIQHTMCGNLIDFYLRRVPLFLSKPDHGFNLLESLSQIFAKNLSWSEESRLLQIQEVHNHPSFEMSWK